MRLFEDNICSICKKPIRWVFGLWIHKNTPRNERHTAVPMRSIIQSKHKSNNSKL